MTNLQYHRDCIFGLKPNPKREDLRKTNVREFQALAHFFKANPKREDLKIQNVREV